MDFYLLVQQYELKTQGPMKDTVRR